MCVDKNIQTTPNRKQNSPTNHAMDCTTYHIPKYMDVDSNIYPSMDDIANLFRKQRLYLRDTTKDNLLYIPRKLLVA
jgi:hypothetical protein